MQTVLVLVLVPVGLIAGGFATMLADRALDDTSLSITSRCPHCGATLSWADTVPVLSWVRLRGRCRTCAAPITVGYPLVEVATAAGFAWVAWRYDQTDWFIVVPLVLVTAGAALSATDLYTYRLPNRIVFPTFWVSLVAMVILAVLEREDVTLVIPAVLAGGGYFAFLLVFNLVYPPAMGFGDVKLALVLGLHTGWVASVFFGTTTAVIQLTFAALLIGAFAYVGFALVVTALRTFVSREILPDPEADADDDQPVRRMALPLGPGLILGTLIVILYPDAVVSWLT